MAVESRNKCHPALITPRLLLKVSRRGMIMSQNFSCPSPIYFTDNIQVTIDNLEHSIISH